MTLQLIAQLTLLVAALFDLCAMLRFDLMMIQHNEYSNKKYRDWLTDSGNLMSGNRLLPFVVMFGACTTMARESWMVVMILAAALIVQGIVALCKKHELKLTVNTRAARLYCCVLAIAVIAVGAGAYYARFTGDTSIAEAGACTATLALTCLPGIVMLANWLLKPVERWIEKK